MGTVGSIVGGEAERRARNVADANAQLERMREAGAIASYEHRNEPARNDPSRIIDVWDVTFAGTDRPWNYPYVQLRALLRGWDLGRRHPHR